MGVGLDFAEDALAAALRLQALEATLGVVRTRKQAPNHRRECLISKDASFVEVGVVAGRVGDSVRSLQRSCGDLLDIWLTFPLPAQQSFHDNGMVLRIFFDRTEKSTESTFKYV